MTNKEWMSTLPAEQFYDTMIWLVRIFGFRFNNTRLGIIAWLDEQHEEVSEENNEQQPKDILQHNKRPV